MTRSITILILLSPLLCRAADRVPLVYLPFDRGAVVGIGRVDGAAVLPEASHPGPDGVRGECLHIAQDLRLPSAGSFSVTDGTVAFWMRAAWQDPGRGHTLFCLYGGEPSNWLHNRWSIVADGKRVSASFYPKEGQKRVELETKAAVGDGQWHHIAWTWRGINTNQDNAELVVYVDGMPAVRRTGLRLNAGKIGPRIDIGRDSDASPDYADAEYDEFYLYPAAFPADVIRRAVQGRGQSTVADAGDTSHPVVYASWPDADRTCRFKIDVDLPTGVAGPVTVRVPLGIESDLAQLGLAAAPRTGSFVVRDAESDAIVPHVLEEGGLLLGLNTDGTAQTRRFIAAFGLNQYDFSVPLAARLRAPPAAPSSDGAFALADYAQTAYGDA